MKQYALALSLLCSLQILAPTVNNEIYENYNLCSCMNDCALGCIYRLIRKHDLSKDCDERMNNYLDNLTERDTPFQLSMQIEKRSR